MKPNRINPFFFFLIVVLSALNMKSQNIIWQELDLDTALGKALQTIESYELKHVDVSHLDSGTYFLKLMFSNTTVNYYKLIKK